VRAFDLEQETIQENCMTNDEMDRAIAEAVGWSDLRKGPYDGGYHGRYKDHTLRPIPRYSTDLNAMHEAEASLTTHGELHAYRMALGMDVSAKANRRAIAFLHVIGKWRIE